RPCSAPAPSPTRSTSHTSRSTSRPTSAAASSPASSPATPPARRPTPASSATAKCGSPRCSLPPPGFAPTRPSTAHYARVVEDAEGPLLAAGADAAKDQSYMLAALPPDLISRLGFP